MIPDPLAPVSRLLAAAGTRRRLLGSLAALPLLGGLDEVFAREGRARKRQRRQDDAIRTEGKGNGKKKRCKRKPIATICAGRCGPVRNRQTCKKTVDCGPCGCRQTSWTSQTTFGTEGNAANRFANPVGISLSPDGLQAVIADTNNSRISVWTRPNAGSTNWSDQITFGGQGTGLNQLSAPFGVALAADGLTVWVADSSNHRISIWKRPSATSANWSNVTTFGSDGPGANQFQYPEHLALSRDELTMWIADTSNGRISVWTRTSAGSNTWLPQTTFGSFGSGPSQFRSPSGVAVAADALTVWVADQDNARISVWTRPSASSTTWSNVTTFGSEGAGANQFSNPTGVALSADVRTVWVADSSNARVSVWTRPNAGSTNWSNVSTFGTPGSAPDQFSNPKGVAILGNGETVLVADNLNDRMSVWVRNCLA